MALTLDTVKNFAEWDQAHWRAFFQTHGPTLGDTEIAQDVSKLIRDKEFQEAMVKVGIIGGRALFDQIPRIWYNQLNSKIPRIAAYGEPRHFTNVSLIVTRLILVNDDFDEALLIKQEEAEPLMLLRLGRTWNLEVNATVESWEGGSCYKTNRTPLIRAWQKFEQASSICAVESARSTLLVEHLTQSHSFSPSLANLAASYNEIFDSTAKVTPTNDRKKPEPAVQRVEAEPLPPLEDTKEPQSWCAYLTEKACSFFSWLLSLFT